MKKRLLALLLCVLALVGVLACYPAAAAEGTYLGLAESSVTDDLDAMSGSVRTQYPMNLSGRLRIMAAYEDAGELYLYVYNPQLTDIVLNSTRNYVQMAVEWDSTGEPQGYAKLPLEYISHENWANSSTQVLYIKYRVTKPANPAWRMAYTPDVGSAAGSRSYVISGIELLTKGNTNATEYRVGGRYRFTGAGQALQCSVLETDVAEITVQHSYYLHDGTTSDAGYTGKQLSTAYFLIPEKFFDDGYNLSALEAQWYQYRVNPIITTNDDLYNAYQASLTPDVKLCAGAINASLTAVPEIVGYRWAYGLPGDTIAKQLPLVLQLDADSISGQTVGREALLEAIYSYRRSGSKGVLRFGRKYISADLFTDYTPQGSNGLVAFGSGTFTLRSPGDYLESGFGFRRVVVTSGDFWETNGNNFRLGVFSVPSNSFLAGLFGQKETAPASRETKALEVADMADVTLDDAAMASKYRIAIADAAAFRKTMRKGIIRKERLVLFRYDDADYTSYTGIYCNDPSCAGVAGFHKETDCLAVNSMPIYLDFDIIQLAFAREGDFRPIKRNLTTTDPSVPADRPWKDILNDLADGIPNWDDIKVVPVISSPTDFIADLVTPKDITLNTWLTRLLQVIGLLLLVILGIVFIPKLWPFLRMVWQFVTTPFRWAGQKIKNKKQTKKRKK